MFETGRRLFDVALSYLGKLDDVDKVLVVEAPTGYGKTVGAPTIAALNYLKGFSSNFIHILPLRAIVEDLYICKYLYASGVQIDRCRGDPPKAFFNALNELDVNTDDIAYQMGFDYMLRGVGRKEPTYDAKIVISTLDSFAYNFLRIPVTEFYREIKHYAIPRTRILTATLFLDEVHMINRFEDESSEKILSLLKILIEFSLNTKTPLVMATATLWSLFREKILLWSKNNAMFFTIFKEDGKNGKFIYVRDREFEDRARSIKWSTTVIDENTIVSKIMEHVESGEKVLVVRDRVNDAVNLYSKLGLGEDEKALIHGRLCLGDRERALENSRSAKVVIATPVVEAGVDWDFDAGFRDATNIPSIIQVFGRICRNRVDCKGSVYLIKTSESLEELVSFVNSNRNIDWRIPYSYIGDNGEEVRGYQQILELQKTLVSEDGKAETIFRGLIAPVAIPSRYISMFLEDNAYSLLKEPLIQFYVYGEQRLRNAKSVYDVILGTFTYTYEIVKKNAKCVENFTCVVESSRALYYEKYNWKERYSSLQRRCAEFASRLKGRIIFSGYILKEECYKEMIGFI